MPTDTVDEFSVLKERMRQIKKKVVVLSGKGGVGKSTVAANLALSLAAKGSHVGLLDADIHGPSIPTLFGKVDTPVTQDGNILKPAVANGIKLMSAGFLIPHPDHALIVRGPMKMKILEQMLQDVDWGELDYLIVDCPPGTGDEPLSICQLIDPPDGAVMVTTPQEVAAADVRKCIQFCRKLDLPILGILENMSAFVCPTCGEVFPMFGKDGGRMMAEKYNLAFLGNIPIDPAIGVSADKGTGFVLEQSAATQAFEKAVEQIHLALKILPNQE